MPFKKDLTFLWNRALDSYYLKNIFSLGAGTLLSQIITVLLSPLITRLYTPADFGLFSLFVSYQAVFIIFCTMKSEQILMQEKYQYVAHNMLFFGLIWNAIFCSFIAIFIYFYGPGDSFLKSGQPQWLFYFMVILLFSMAAQEILKYYAFRLKMFKNISYIFIFISFFNSGLSILTGYYFYHESINLFLSLFLAYFFSNSFLIYHFFSHKSLLKNIYAKIILKNLKKKGKFMISLSLSQVMGVFATQLPAIFIGFHYGLKILGFYALGYRLVSLPSQIIAGAIGDVFRKHATDSFHQKKRFDYLFKNTFILTLLLSLPPFIFLYLTAPWLFKIVFGSQWELAGEYTKILCIGSFFAFLSIPLNKGIIIRQKQKYMVFWNFFYLFSNAFLIFFIFIFDFNIFFYLYMYSFINAIFYTVDLSYNYHLSKP